jgi:CheY-like chemotaxis protein
MEACEKPITILVADDDEEDQLIIRAAVQSACPCFSSMNFVNDGQELLDYLSHLSEYASKPLWPCPDLVLLDLNMPRKSGLDALREIRADPLFVRLPIIVFSTSREEMDVARSYDTGANTYVAKPMTFDGLVSVIEKISHYWCEVATLPEVRGWCGDNGETRNKRSV